MTAPVAAGALHPEPTGHHPTPTVGPVTEAAASAMAFVGPLAMRLAGLQASLLLALALTVAIAGALRAAVGRGPVVRALLIGAGGVILIPVTGILVGLWFAAGGLLGEWVLRGRPPLARLAPLHPHARVAMVLLSAPAMFLPNTTYRTIPFTLAAIAHLGVLQAVPAPRARRALPALGVVLLLGIALLARPSFNGTSSVLLAGVALAVALAAMWVSEPGARWRWTDRTSVLAAAWPAAAWAAVNVGLTVDGARQDGTLGVASWGVGLSLHAPAVQRALALTGIPSVLVGLLAIGAHVAIEGRSGAAAAARATAIAFAASVAVALGWTVVLPLG